MPEERFPVKGVFSQVVFLLMARLTATVCSVVGVRSRKAVPVRRHLVPLVRCAALWGVHGHAFATSSTA